MIRRPQSHSAGAFVCDLAAATFGILVVLAGIGLAVSLGYLSHITYTAASWLVVGVISWAFLSWHLAGRSLFEPYTLFLLSAALFNGGSAVLQVTRLMQPRVLTHVASEDITVRALYLVAVGITSLHFGALIAASKTARLRNNSRIDVNSTDRYRRVVRFVGYTCLVMSIVPAMLYAHDTITTVAAGGYSALYGRSRTEASPSSIRILAGFLLPGAMYLVASANRRRSLPAIIAGVVVISYSGTMLLAGSRSRSAMALIAFVWLYHTSVRRVSRATLMVGGIALLATFPIVAAVRNIPGIWHNPSEAFSIGAERQDNLLTSAIDEMGGSLITVIHTVDLVPHVRPFDFGRSYGYALTTVIPSIAWETHPAIARGLLADWLIWTVAPSRAAVGGGLGFSFIAEAYLNFGWWGGALTLAIIGYSLGRFFQWGVVTDDCAKRAAVATFLGFCLFFARGESASFVRALVWYSLLPYLAVIRLAKYSMKGSQWATPPRGFNVLWSLNLRSRPRRGRSCDSLRSARAGEIS